MNRYYFGSEQLVIEATNEDARAKLQALIEKGEIKFIVDDVDEDCI